MPSIFKSFMLGGTSPPAKTKSTLSSFIRRFANALSVLINISPMLSRLSVTLTFSFFSAAINEVSLSFFTPIPARKEFSFLTRPSA